VSDGETARARERERERERERGREGGRKGGREGGRESERERGMAGESTHSRVSCALVRYSTNAGHSTH
jgi:hypothetical protein